jgi:hypothetical protein
MSGFADRDGRWPIGTNVDVHVGRKPRGSTGTGFSVAALLVSIAFLVLLIVAPERLDAAYVWIRDLPIVVEVFAWVVLLPWMLAYLVWTAPWVLWLRIVLILILLGGVAQSFWRRNS